jgi:hypothetical protein
MIDLPNKTQEEWLQEIPSQHLSYISDLLKNNDELTTAELWLAKNISLGNIRNRDSDSFFERFQEEFKNFICDDTTYSEDKAKLKSSTNHIEKTLISTVSTLIALKLGVTATVLVPPVILLFSALGKIGLKAFCSKTRKNVVE